MGVPAINSLTLQHTPLQLTASFDKTQIDMDGQFTKTPLKDGGLLIL